MGHDYEWWMKIVGRVGNSIIIITSAINLQITTVRQSGIYPNHNRSKAAIPLRLTTLRMALLID
jgi:hypothetical protein